MSIFGRERPALQPANSYGLGRKLLLAGIGLNGRAAPDVQACKHTDRKRQAVGRHRRNLAAQQRHHVEVLAQHGSQRPCGALRRVGNNRPRRPRGPARRRPASRPALRQPRPHQARPAPNAQYPPSRHRTCPQQRHRRSRQHARATSQTQAHRTRYRSATGYPPYRQGPTPASKPCPRARPSCPSQPQTAGRGRHACSRPGARSAKTSAKHRPRSTRTSPRTRPRGPRYAPRRARCRRQQHSSRSSTYAPIRQRYGPRGPRAP